VEVSKFRGSIDVPLTDKGYHQMLETALWLRQSFDRVEIYHDWQERTRHSAEILAAVFERPNMCSCDVASQRLGWLEGKEVNEETLEYMRFLVANPHKVPEATEDCKSPQSFCGWLSAWFKTLDEIEADQIDHAIIVTHNRNIQAAICREGDWINEANFDCLGPRPAAATFYRPNITLVRHGETSFGT